MSIAISEDILRYCERHSSPDSSVCRALAKETRVRTRRSSMLTGQVEGAFLSLLARSTGARRVLEIGCFTGYSALKIAEGLPPDGRVITCDIDPKTTLIARRFWTKSPHGKKITLKLGPALETIESLEGPFDLVFIDADKENYINYWEACVPKVPGGGLILVDNVLWSGSVLDPKEKDDHAIVAFNRHAARDARVDLVMLTVRDGVTMACKKYSG
jgi:caffeoyl-CoA O-methyltransferase